MSKRRKKRRQPLPQLPRPRRVRDGEQQPPPAAQATKPAPTADNLGSQPADRQVTGTILAVECEFILIDVDGQESQLYASELMLDAGETPSQRYAVGDTFDAFVFQMEPDPESGLPQFSIRRATPYPDALNRLKVGAIVNATVVNTYDVGIELDIDGVRGNALFQDLPLAPGESPHDRYQPGDALEQLFVWQVDPDTRGLALSVRRGAPGYVKALNTHTAGEVVSGVVTGSQSNVGLWLNVDGVIGSVRPDELAFADDQSTQDRYAIGDTVSHLFVWQVDRNTRDLDLSVRRSAPDYVEALAAHSVGEVVSGVVTAANEWGIQLDIDGVVGSISLQELVLADGQSAQDRYAVDDTVHDLFVWQVDRSTRDLDLSVRRNAPGYVEALNARSVGEVVAGVVTDFQGNGGLWLDVDGVTGSVPPWDLPLADGESVQDRYPIDGTVDGLFVWQVNHDVRLLGLSVRRNALAYVEALAARSVGEVVPGVVTQPTEWGIWLDVAGVEGWIPTSELALDEGQSPHDSYPVDQPIEARVWQIDRISRTAILSVRRLHTDFIEDPIAPGATVNGIVRGSPPGGIRVLAAGSDLLVRRCELSLFIGDQPHFEYGQDIPLVVLAVDSNGQPTALSHRRALPDWQAEVSRLVPGVIVQDAQILPPGALLPGENRVSIDLGPVTGFVDHDELNVGYAEAMMREEANTQYSVVIKSIDADRGDLIVSHDKFEERWRELAEAVPVGEPVPAELRRISPDKATLDLGSGLLAELPQKQLPTVKDTGERRRAREGETFTVLITDKDEERHLIVAENKNQWLADLIAKGENQTCEFKAVFKGPKPDRPNKDVEPYNGLPVLRAMAGLMNRNGGYVLIGVQDDAKNKSDVISWQRSGFTSEDKMMSALSDLASTKLTSNPPFNLSFEPLPNGDRILVVDCKVAKDPIYLQHGGKELFFVRWPAVTKEMDGSELVNYIQNNFPNRAAAG